MANRSSFLKNLLTTASALAVTVGAAEAMAIPYARLVTNAAVLATPAKQDGTNLDQDATPANAAVTDGSSLTFRGAHTYEIGAAPANLSGIQVDSDAKATVTGGAALANTAITIGSITKKTGKAGSVTLNTASAGNTFAVTLTGTAVTPLAYLDPAGKNDWAFTAAADDYTGLEAIIVQNNTDRVIFNSAASTADLATKIDGAGVFEVNSTNVVLSGLIGSTTVLGKLQIDASKNATIANTAKITAITLGNNSVLTSAGGKKITAATMDGSGADQGTFKVTGSGTTTLEIAKVGNTAKLHQVEIGAGTADFTTATVYKATNTVLTTETSVIKFSNAGAALELNTDFTTAIDGKGTIIATGDDRIFKGAVGAADKRLAEINITTAHLLTFKKDDTALYVNAITTKTDGTGQVSLEGNNIDIYADIGTADKKLDVVFLDGNAAGTAAATVRLKEGKTIFTANAGGVALSDAANKNNILELYEGSSINGEIFTNSNGNGTLSVKGSSTVTGGVIHSGGNIIDQVRFDSTGTLTLNKNIVETTNGVTFSKDGVLSLTENAGFTFDQAVVVAENAGGTGSIIVNNAGFNKVVQFDGQVGDVAVNNKSLKLLEVKGGAAIVLSGANTMSFRKIDVGTQDSILELKSTGLEYFIGEFAHSDGKGTIKISRDATLLKKGTNISTATNRLKEISFTGDFGLGIEDGVNLFATDGIKSNAAGEGTLVVFGNSVIDTVVGSNVAINGIVIGNPASTSATAIFKQKVNVLNGVAISPNATAIFESEVLTKIGEVIGGVVDGNGTVEFNNRNALTAATAIISKIGDAGHTLNTVKLGGADIEFTHAVFKTNNLAFTSTGNMTATFSGINADTFANTVITSTGNKQHNIALIAGKNQTFNQTVGSADHALGNFILAGDDTLTFNAAFYGSVTTPTTGKGTVILAGQDSVAYNLGSAGLELKLVTLSNNLTAGNVYSKNIGVDANKEVTFQDVISSSAGITLNNGSKANFANGTTLDATVNGFAANQGIASFGQATITKTIGDTRRLQRIEFIGEDETEIAKVGANLSATDIAVGAQTFEATDNITLNGNTVFTGSFVNLGAQTVTLTNGNSRLANDVTIGVTLAADNTTIGKLVVDGIGSSFDPNLANSLQIEVTDNAVLPTTTQTFDLFSLSNSATLTPLNKGSISSSNRFVKWTLSGNKITRENNATTALEAILSGSSAADRAGEIAKTYGNANNTGDAAKYIQELAQIQDNAQVQESVKRLTNSASAHVSPIVSQTNEGIKGFIGGRIATLSSAIQTVSAGTTGISAGDNMAFGAWISPFYSTSTQKAQGGSAGYKLTSTGGTIGFDTEINPDMILGLAGSFVKTNTKHQDFKSGDRTKLDTFVFSIYGTQKITDSWFLQGYASFASSKVKNTEKRITLAGNQTATGSFDTTSYSAELLAGYNIAIDETVVTPMIGASFTRINDGGYKEDGTTNQNLTISKKASSKAEAVAGVRAQMTSSMEGIDVTPEVHGFVRHDFIGKNSKVTANHAGLATQLTPQSAKVHKTMLNLGVGVNAVSGTFEYGLGYDFFTSSDTKLTTHQGTLKLRVNF